MRDLIEELVDELGVALAVVVVLSLVVCVLLLTSWIGMLALGAAGLGQFGFVETIWLKVAAGALISTSVAASR